MYKLKIQCTLNTFTTNKVVKLEFFLNINKFNLMFVLKYLQVLSKSNIKQIH